MRCFPPRLPAPVPILLSTHILLAFLKTFSSNFFNLRFVRSSPPSAGLCVHSLTYIHIHTLTYMRVCVITHTDTHTLLWIFYFCSFLCFIISPIWNWNGNGHRTMWRSSRMRKRLGGHGHVLASVPESNFYQHWRHWLIKTFWHSRCSGVYHRLCLTEGNKA